jgi:hypothetical protein
LNSGKIAFSFVVLAVAVGYCEGLAIIISPGFWAYGISVNFMFLGAFGVVLAALKLQVLPSSYFLPNSFERDGRIYRWTGIRVFVGFLRLIGWERVMRRSTPIRHDESALRKYSDSTKDSETLHLVAAIFTAVFTLTVAWRYSFAETKWLCLSNVLMNAYPVMLQRYNRPRVESLLHRLERNRRAVSTEIR